MPSKRTRTARSPAAGKITAAALEAFRAHDWMRLHSELGLEPWAASPLDVVECEPPKLGDPTEWAASWPRAVQLHEALEAALANETP